MDDIHIWFSAEDMDRIEQIYLPEELVMIVGYGWGLMMVF